MTKPDRRAYIEAVQCLRTLPAKSDKSWAAAAKTRFDDFVAIHVNQTMYIHGNGLFLTWHRYFVWAYEQALRNECGYKGYQPVRLEMFNGPNISDFASTGTGSPIPMISTSHRYLTGVTPA
jgi:tyrosinase